MLDRIPHRPDGREGRDSVKTVEPLRDKRQIEAIRKILAAQNLRDAAWFTLGINSGLRISDLLNLRVGDVRESPTKWRDRIRITEQKTGKMKDFPLSDRAKKALATYLATRPDAKPTDPLFPSRKHGRPLKRGQAWQILRDAARAVGVTDPVGTQTMRKMLWIPCPPLRGRSRHHSADFEPQQPRDDARLYRHSPGRAGCGVFGVEFMRFPVDPIRVSVSSRCLPDDFRRTRPGTDSFPRRPRQRTSILPCGYCPIWSYC